MQKCSVLLLENDDKLTFVKKLIPLIWKKPKRKPIFDHNN